MTRAAELKTFDEALAYLRDHEFDVLEAPGTASRVFLKKLNCSAAIEKDEQGGVKVFARPGYLVSGEISKLVDRGYQKFLKTSKAEVPAAADHLKSLHQFSEELREATGATSLYNQSLGTVSDQYVYDRVEDRDEPETARPKRPWQAQEASGKAAKRRA